MKKHLKTAAMTFVAVLVAVCLAGIVSAEQQPTSADTQVTAPTDTPSPATTDTQPPASNDLQPSTEAPAPTDTPAAK